MCVSVRVCAKGEVEGCWSERNLVCVKPTRQNGDRRCACVCARVTRREGQIGNVCVYVCACVPVCHFSKTNRFELFGHKSAQWPVHLSKVIVRQAVLSGKLFPSRPTRQHVGTDEAKRDIHMLVIGRRLALSLWCGGLNLR